MSSFPGDDVGRCVEKSDRSAFAARQLIEGTRTEVKRLQRSPPDLNVPSTNNVKDLFPKEMIEAPAVSHQVYDRQVNLRLKNLVVLTGPWNPLSNAVFVSLFRSITL